MYLARTEKGIAYLNNIDLRWRLVSNDEIVETEDDISLPITPMPDEWLEQLREDVKKSIAAHAGAGNKGNRKPTSADNLAKAREMSADRRAEILAKARAAKAAKRQERQE